MKTIFLVTLLFVAPSWAWAVPTLADLQGAVMQGDYKKAGDMAGELSRQRLSRSDSAEVRYYAALSSLRTGDYAAAQEGFRKLIAEHFPGDMYDRASAGHVDALYMQGQYDLALKEALSLIAKRRDSEMMSLFYLKAARASLKLARWAKAREFLQKIVDEYPQSFESSVARQLLEEKQYFTVQVGSFAEKDRAEKMVREIMARQEYAYVLETKSPDGKVMYRVRVGQLSALKDARTLESKLSGLGYPTLIYP